MDVTSIQELKSPTELAVYEALLDACVEQRDVIALSDGEKEELRLAASSRRYVRG